MYSIFHPLDVNERLPRELILEGRRWRFFGLHHLEIAAYLYLPALILTIVVMGSLNLSVLLAFGIAGAALIGFFVYAISAKYR